MSKSTHSRQFARVNVDAFDPDRFEDDTVESDAGTQGPNEGEVQTLLTQNKNAEALKVVLSNPPVSSKNQAVKDRATQLVMKVMLNFKSSEIESAINGLDQPLQDTLMKYIYRGFEFPTEGSSAQLLIWHEKAFAKGGYGSIVRVLTDRKRV